MRRWREGDGEKGRKNEKRGDRRKIRSEKGGTSGKVNNNHE